VSKLDKRRGEKLSAELTEAERAKAEADAKWLAWAMSVPTNRSQTEPVPAWVADDLKRQLQEALERARPVEQAIEERIAGIRLDERRKGWLVGLEDAKDAVDSLRPHDVVRDYLLSARDDHTDDDLVRATKCAAMNAIEALTDSSATDRVT
jgi:hypothetical protein